MIEDNKKNDVNNLNTSLSNNQKELLQNQVKNYNEQKNLHNQYNEQNGLQNNVMNNANKQRMFNSQKPMNRNLFRKGNSNKNLSSNDSTLLRIKNAQNKKGHNSHVTNQLASKGLSAAGVPAGVSEKIVNSKFGQKAISNLKKKNPALSALDKLTGGSGNNSNEMENMEGYQNFEIPKKVIHALIIASPAVLTVIIFCCLFMCASQVYLNIVGLGNADKFTSQEADEKIEKFINDHSDDIEDILNKEIEDVAYVPTSQNTIYAAKFKSLNYMPVLTNSNKLYNNEAELEELEDYYSGMSNYINGEYDINVVYAFFFKLMYIQKYYQKNYSVSLDLPLIMATLRLQSSDMGDVFSSNIVDYNVKLKEDNPMFAHNYDWSSYVTSKTKSSHDIEVLAQHMIVKTDSGYKRDDEAYREFLKEFLEKKYYLDGKVALGGNESNNTNNEINNNISKPNENISSAVNGDYKTWTQCGQSWSGYKLGSSTMCNIGCLVTSISIQIARSGTVIIPEKFDPGIALNYLTFSSSGSLYNWESMRKISPNFGPYTRFSVAGWSQANIAEKLLSYDSSKYYFILHVGKIGRSNAHHFVAVNYVDPATNKIYIFDPSGTSYQEVYEHYRVYRVDVLYKED